MAPDTPDDGDDLTAEQLSRVIAAIDEANALDPNQLDVRGRSGPKELLHAEMMTEWVERLDPRASTAQLVAARAHHLRRWTRPRSDYPEGRAGYRRWRQAAAKAQAGEVATILREQGARDRCVSRVGEIITKEGLGRDPAVQTHEDALCLVFLETQLDELIESLGEDHAGQVLARTVPKMSPEAVDIATTLPLSEGGRAALVAAADAVKREASQ